MDPASGSRVSEDLLVSADPLARAMRAEANMAGQKRILEMVATGAPLPETLDALVRFIENQEPGMRCGIMLVSESGEHFSRSSGPNLPEAYHAALDQVSISPPYLRSCGEAAHRRVSVDVHDLAEDQRYAPQWRDLLLAHGIRSVHSTPVVDRAGRALAALGMYRSTPGDPRPSDPGLIETATHLASIVLEHHRSEQQRRRVEQENEAALAELEAVYRTMPAGLAVLDGELRYVRVNDTLAEMNGVPAADHIGKTVREVVPDVADGVEEYFRRVFDTGEPAQSLEFEAATHALGCKPRVWLENASPLRSGDGTVRWVLVTVAEITERKAAEAELQRHRDELERLVEERTAELLREAEERRRTEDALRQNEKMAALGQLTGGVAHDFNNIVQVVASGIALLRKPGLSEVRRLSVLDGLEKATENAKQVTGHLLAFARRQALRPEVFDLNARLAKMSELIGHSVGSNVHIETDFDPGVWPIKADPIQLEVSILNLAANARDAMPNGGTLLLRTRNVTLEARPDQDAGEYVELSVCDTGQGMHPAIVARVFEPFFTTKDAGTGTGLGLAQVFGFVKQSGGDIEVESAIGQGTTITLYFPRAEGTVSGITHRTEPAASLQWAAGTTVLVVDDNRSVAEFAGALLHDMGCNALKVHGAEDALTLLASGVGVDVVFSDIMMKGPMNGLDLALAIKSEFPSVGVVLTTGYSHLLTKDEYQNVAEIVRKPYGSHELSAAIERALSQQTLSRSA